MLVLAFDFTPLKANKLACNCFMDVGRRHNSLGTETKPLLCWMLQMFIIFSQNLYEVDF